MRTTAPPTLETFGHWPSWLNARGHVDRSACFELKVSEVRRLTGCVPMTQGKYGQQYRAKRRAHFNVPDLPNEQPAINGKGRLSTGWCDIAAYQLDWILRGRFPRGLAGDWRTARAPAMRPTRAPGVSPEGMTLNQGGYGPGQYAYERRNDDFIEHGIDAGLQGNPNRGACREKVFGLRDGWSQRLWLEKWEHPSVSGKQYFLLCPGPRKLDDTGEALKSRINAKGLKGLTGTTSNCGDGSGGAHGKGWVCGQRVYKLFWVLARPGEVRDAQRAQQWIMNLTSGQLARQSRAVSELIQRYGPIMGNESQPRMLRCRRCLQIRYGQSPEVLRKKRRAPTQRDQ